MFFAAGADRRVATAIALVVALHAMLIAIVLTRRDAAAPVALGSHAIAAELLQPDPVAVAAAVNSPPTPPKPVQRVAPAKPAARPMARPMPLPVAQAPSEHQNETPAQAGPTPTAAAPSVPEVSQPAAAARGKPTMELSAPKNVPHLDCRIAQPDYPMLSKRRGETGTASVGFVVGLSGQIEDIQLKKSSGYSRLDDAALAAMRDSACKPYMENGEPVRAAYTQPFDFSLHN
ncbi:energy transducer TonB [Paraburkholderia dinghuensis]|uniref:Energy transducer TonB n=1 Tax=Paraburkholderia dinghuensis TaxID=2305225 RepID=A0A3N6N0W4_9BURK|nr:energy transducer TonB [Paraburkholderia dinghuensis]RQH09824.1 energy transducer TonB [Paraburkholderia dinghuensis]